MATYKVLQDIEAEDKLVGPLTLWQFIYALIAGFCIYLGAIAVMKGVPYFLIILTPISLFVTFLAIPWSGEQPTEVWALAKLRFFLKPRRRIWDQTGMTELVTVTAPKREVRYYSNGLSKGEVNSRLRALASTLDSRGWAVKNVSVNLATSAPSYSASDRLIDISSTPQDIPALDIRPDDDMLDEQANPVAHTFDTMIDEATSEYHKTLVNRMNNTLPVSANDASYTQYTSSQNQAHVDTATQSAASMPVAPVSTVPLPQTTTPSSQPSADFWFAQQPTATPLLFDSGVPTDSNNPDPTNSMSAQTNPIISTIPQAGEPTEDDTALIERIKAQENQQTAAYGHLKTLKTPEQIEEDARLAMLAKIESDQRVSNAKATTHSLDAEKQAAIMNFSRSNDLSVDTLARQAKQIIADDKEVVIELR